MALIQFVQNTEDLSTDRGYQFKFFCDKCGNGHMSRFEASTIGTAGAVLRSVGSLLGGWASSAGNSAYELQRAVGGKAHDAALENAVREGREHFHQCSRCGRWVCPEVCWNAAAKQCEGCAPDFDEEFASSHAHSKADASRQQLGVRAIQTDYVAAVDMSAKSTASAPDRNATTSKKCDSCGGETGQAKFCPECGSPVQAAPKKCGGCGFAFESPAKFCPECGLKS